jgi:hypothetical protein
MCSTLLRRQSAAARLSSLSRLCVAYCDEAICRCSAASLHRAILLHNALLCLAPCHRLAPHRSASPRRRSRAVVRPSRRDDLSLQVHAQPPSPKFNGQQALAEPPFPLGHSTEHLACASFSLRLGGSRIEVCRAALLIAAIWIPCGSPLISRAHTRPRLLEPQRIP